ncbi:MAG: hypothetical protein NWE95_12550 [Candidatus Bathyarchaeota archaeon]|jgi:hypothetical protein|nr:hypothetical protein [Candidatus Bathyarchaeota archaeon]
MIVISASPVKAAGDAEWITDYKVVNAQTDQVLLEYDASTNETTRLGAIVPGIDIKITFTVNVIASGEGNLKLTTYLAKPSSGAYWSYDDTYDLGAAFSPNTATTSFNWVAGEFEITLNGKVPSTTSSAKSIDAVSLAGPSGKQIDKLTITATTAEMSNYLTLYEAKEKKLQSLKDSGVDAGFTAAFEKVLEISQDVANGGDVENAIALLNGIDVANPPAGSVMQMMFLPIIAITAIVAVLFAVLFLRLRGKVSYFQLVVEDQIKDLEGLTLRASKIDRTMSSSLESVKDRLKRLVGM